MLDAGFLRKKMASIDLIHNVLFFLISTVKVQKLDVTSFKSFFLKLFIGDLMCWFESQHFPPVKWSINGTMESDRVTRKTQKTFENIIASHPTTQDTSDNPITCLTIKTKIEKNK